MGAAFVLLYAAGLVAAGYGLLALAPAATLHRMLRLEKFGAALLLGQGAVALGVLFGLFAGGTLSGTWYAGGCGLGLFLLLLGHRKWGALWLCRADGASLPMFPAPVVLFLLPGFLALAGWAVLAAAFLPTVDYDSLATWTYRVRVLFAERNLYVEALRDPVRLVPMRQHPFLLPVMEVGPVFALGRFSYAATHLPHVMTLAGFYALSWAAVRRLAHAGKTARAGALFAALLLMPAPAVQLSQESVREIMIGFYGLGAVYFLARWAETPRWLFILLAGFYGLVAQQIKVEGIPFVLGLALGAALLQVGSEARVRRLRLLQWGAAVALVAWLALPWWVVLNTLPQPTVHGYDFSADLDVTFGDRLRAVPKVMRVALSELFARPELYGLSCFAAIAGLGYGWSRRNAAARFALLAAPAACLAGILMVYLGRNERLPAERNVTFSRRMMCAVPALVFAGVYIPVRARRQPGAKNDVTDEVDRATPARDVP